MKEVFAALKVDGVDVFVFDLRDNVGGLFFGVLEIVKVFMNEGMIVYIVDFNGECDVF